MKHLIGFLLIFAIALAVRFGVSSQLGLDIHVHDTYYVIPIRAVVFWLLISIPVVWFVVAAYKSVRLDG
jgi:hypothetical protein